MHRPLRIRRRGAIVVLAAILLPVLGGMIAFGVDYGFLVKAQSDLQRAADAAALASVQSILSDESESGDVETVREIVREYATRNLGAFTVADSDIEVGRFDPATIHVSPTLLSDGTFDAVRVTFRRDGESNPRAPLFFARLFGQNETALVASATAVLQKAQHLPAGANVLPFATPQSVWDEMSVGDRWDVYGDGKMKDSAGSDIPGNWGTVDIGAANNSTNEGLNEQILNGLRQSDLDALYADGRIGQASYIDSSSPAWMNADTGLSSGLKHSVQEVHGMKRIVPIFDQSNAGTGNNLEFRIVKWGVVTVVDSNWHGAKNTYVRVEKSRTYQGELHPVADLSSTSGDIDGAYTSPVLVK